MVDSCRAGERRVAGWWATAVAFLVAPLSGAGAQAPVAHFSLGEQCLACHNGMTSSQGEDLSIGMDWSATMMANSSRDPYWQAAVRREALDHPESAAAIEAECARCHMPMMSLEAEARGEPVELFANLPSAATSPDADAVAAMHRGLAADGVSCSVCHRIEPEGLGSEESFVGHFEIDLGSAAGPHTTYGPFDVDEGLVEIMRSATSHVPQRGEHVRSSELCASCHTLLTHTLGEGGAVLGELPEQVPYLGWRHSDFAASQSCQSCHMPQVEGEVPISSVLGEPREGVARHAFRGGNFFVLRMLGRYRDELAVTAPTHAFEAAARRTLDHLAEASARLEVQRLDRRGGVLEAELRIEALTGHKLPTAYPSRRAWLHVALRDTGGNVLWQSGAVRPDGSIAGNDNDVDPDRFEPHRRVVEQEEDVQIYEAILADPAGRLTTGLLTALSYAKDNRLLPSGFDKHTAEERIAVHGGARDDADFVGGGDRIVYRIEVGEATGPLRFEARLLYQPIGYRWAENLAPYADLALEAERFLRYYREMSAESTAVLAEVVAKVP